MNVILRSVLCDEGSQPGHEGDHSLSLSWARRRTQDDAAEYLWPYFVVT